MNFTVVFLKEFTSGILKGMTFEDKISFPTLDLALDFTNLREVTKPIAGSSGYKIIWTHVQAD